MPGPVTRQKMLDNELDPDDVVIYDYFDDDDMIEG